MDRHAIVRRATAQRRPLLVLGAALWLAGRLGACAGARTAGGGAAAVAALLALLRRALGRRARHAAGPARTRVGAGDRALGDAAARQLERCRLGRGTGEAAAVALAAGRAGTALRGAGALEAETVVEIGSVTKTFTGVLLADLAQAGLVGLEDPVGRFVAGLAPRVAAITLLDLATHTSGLPRLPGALLARALVTDPADPYADWDAARLERALRRVRVRRARRWRYSNLGAGLLGEALSRAAGDDYGTLVEQRICAPLGLRRTGVAPQDPATWAVGHDAVGLPVAPWHLAALAGAGALRSTAADLERWTRAQLDPGATPLAPALELAQRPWRRAPGGQRIGLGWMLRGTDDGRTVHWHDGGTGGFGAFVGFDRRAGVGVALVQTITHRPALDAAGIALLDELAARAPR